MNKDKAWRKTILKKNLYLWSEIERQNKISELLSIWNNVSKSGNAKGNPYHDDIGRFTFSPYKSYTGDATKAVGIWNGDYRKIMKEFDINTLTKEERKMIESYVDTPFTGNSSDKNSEWKEYTAWFDQDGNELTSEEIKKFQETVKQKAKEQGVNVWQISDELFEQTGWSRETRIRPAQSYTILKPEYLDKPDAFITGAEALKLAKKTVGIKEYKEFSKLDYHQQTDKLNEIKKKYGECSKEYSAYSCIHDSQHSYTREEDFAPSNTKKWYQNKITYADSKYYLSSSRRKYWDSEGNLSNWISVQEFSTSTSDKDLERYAKVYKDTNLKSFFKQEKIGRALNNVINTKGVALDHDVVVTRRVNSTKKIQSDIEIYKFYTQYGFTSTAGAANLAKKTPGGMKLGDNIVKIVIPAGTKFMPVEKVIQSPSDGESRGNGILRQHEILLPQGTKYIPYSDYMSIPYGELSEKWGVKDNETAIGLVAVTEYYAKSKGIK